jgi:hypothetical protein
MTIQHSPSSKYRVNDKVTVSILQRGGFITVKGIVTKCVYGKNNEEFLVIDCTSDSGLNFVVKGYASKLLVEHEV